MLTDTKFMSAVEKQQVLDQWERFLSSGFKWHFFNKALYNHLIQHCSFIAHYNRLGFYDEYFRSPEQTRRFLSQWKTGLSVEYGMGFWLTDSEYNDINSMMVEIARPYTNCI
jgi:hypothetical protein